MTSPQDPSRRRREKRRRFKKEQERLLRKLEQEAKPNQEASTDKTG